MNTGNDSQSLKEKTAQGLFWGFMSSGGTQLLNLAIGIFLARLLSPEEYGVVGMLAVFSMIAVNLQDSGFGVALINIKDIKHNDYNSVFWFNIGVSVILYLLLFLCSPLIASFFRQPCLTSLSRYVFLGFLFSALGITSNAVLTRNLMVKEKAVITLFALAVSGTVSVVMAFKGFSYWSLATQQVLFNAITCFGRFFYARWWPTFHVDFTPVKKMFSFSYKVLITTILGSISNNVLTVIFGRLFPAAAVGNYTQANKWENMAHWLIYGTVTQVAQPVLARINDDQERQRRVFGKILRFTAFMSFPAMFGLALVAPELITVAIGPQWKNSIPLLQILCISGAFLPIYVVYQQLFLSLGKSNIYMWLNIFQIVITIATVLACHRLGMTAMVVAFAAITVIWLMAWQFFASRLVGYGFVNMLRDLVPFMLIAFVVMVLTRLITLPIGNLTILLLVKVVVAAALYALALKLTRAKIYDECVSFIRSRIKK